ncbi:MAG TPA: DUF1736 domain-containing protein [Phycisphaerae bacterium]|nr:DUF1736 domain-containing protein [Phycisphaerae bacterium]HNU45804.1 DUF1736 domain-containing protein [Phycisphaerae bacterium]
MPGNRSTLSATPPHADKVACSDSGSHLAFVLAAVFLLAGGLLVYGNALPNPFLLDDKILILHDARVQQQQYGALLTGHYWPEPTSNLLYRPLVSLSFALNWRLLPQPWAFRLVNLLLHVGVASLLFGWARSLTRSLLVASVAAALFLVHPIHTGVLNCIVDRAEIGAAFFGLAAISLLKPSDAFPFRTARPPTSGGMAKRSAAMPSGHQAADSQHWWYRSALGALSLAAALLCKENAIMVPAVVVLLDLCRPRRELPLAGGAPFRRRVLRCYVPMAIVTVAYLAVRTSVLDAPVRPAESIAVVDNVIAHPAYGLEPGRTTILPRWGTPLAVFGKAALLLVKPHPLCWDYSYAAIDSVRTVADPRLLVGVGVALVTVVAMVKSWRRQRLALAAVGFSILTFSICSNTYLVIGTIFAERFLYFPSVGFCLLCGLVAEVAARRAARPGHVAWRAGSVALLLLLAAGLVAGAALTVRRNLVYHSEPTLNSVDLRTNPRSARLWGAVATDAYNAGDWARAVEAAEQALRILPAYVPAWRLAGLTHAQLGRFDNAVACLTRYFDSGGQGDEPTTLAFAAALKAKGDWATAVAVLQRHLAGHPTSAAAHNNLAWYLLTSPAPEVYDPAAALPHAGEAMRLDPGKADVIDTYVSVLLALGRHNEALTALRRGLPAVPPDDPALPELQRKLRALEKGTDGD